MTLKILALGDDGIGPEVVDAAIGIVTGFTASWPRAG
jgi:isocitrate/isopropylmalate dehydrogenase